MSFPQSVISRNKYILNQVIAGNSQFDISKITIKYKEHTGDFYVFSQPLKIENTIVNCSAKTMQNIADFLGCSLITEKLANEIWLKSDFRLQPCVRQITSSTQAMIEHSALIGKQLEEFDAKGKLVANGGKHWVIGNKATTAKAVNYGWFVNAQGNSWKGIHLSVPGSNYALKVIQPASTFHDSDHVDYSQTCTLVAQTCIVDGEERNIHDVMRDKDLCGLVSHEGVLKNVRQPGIEQKYYGTLVVGNM